MRKSLSRRGKRVSEKAEQYNERVPHRRRGDRWKKKNPINCVGQEH